jgi:hypothetical protein
MQRLVGCILIHITGFSGTVNISYEGGRLNNRNGPIVDIEVKEPPLGTLLTNAGLVGLCADACVFRVSEFAIG